MAIEPRAVVHDLGKPVSDWPQVDQGTGHDTKSEANGCRSSNNTERTSSINVRVDRSRVARSEYRQPDLSIDNEEQVSRKREQIQKENELVNRRLLEAFARSNKDAH